MSPILRSGLLTARKILSNAPRRNFRRNDLSTKPDELGPVASHRAKARIERITSRLPKFLRGYTAPLVDAPLSHILAFLLLHELTAVVPLFMLAGTFHYTQWLPSSLEEGRWVAKGRDKFERYLKKKGWLEGKNGSQGDSLVRGGSGTRVVIEYVYTLLSHYIAQMTLSYNDADLLLRTQ